MDVLKHIKKDKTSRYDSLPWRIFLLALVVAINLLMPLFEGIAKIVFVSFVAVLALWFIFTDKYIKIEEYVSLRVSVVVKDLVFYRKELEIYRVPLSDIKDIYYEGTTLTGKKLVIKLINNNEHTFSVPFFSEKTVDSIGELKRELGVHHITN